MYTFSPSCMPNHYRLSSSISVAVLRKVFVLSLALFGLLRLSLPLYGQTEGGYLQPDRPDQSEGVGIIRPKGLQLEWGLGTSTRGQSLGLMLRYGVVRDLELRLEGLWRHELGQRPQLTSLGLSSKLALFSGDGWIPAMTLVGYLYHDPEDDRTVTGDLCLALKEEITDRLDLIANVASADGMRHLFLTGELSYILKERWSCFGEYFASFTHSSSPVHGVDAGLAYDLSQSLQVDLSGGVTYTPGGSLTYLAFGGTWKL